MKEARGVALLDLPVCPCQHGAYRVQHSHAACGWATSRNVSAWVLRHHQVSQAAEVAHHHSRIIIFSPLRVVIVYLAGVVFGSVGGSLPSPTSYLAGASAGVYALIAAHVSTLIMNWKVGIL